MTAFDVDRFESLLHTALIGRSLHYRESVDTTMVLARSLAEGGAGHGTLVLAEEQTAGRGRRGRAFQSPAGENLYFTLVLRPPRRAVARLPLAVPVAVCMGIQEEGVDALIKWPNDIWIGDRKACGMLIDLDEEPSGFVAFPGIGINVNGDPTAIPELHESATSLKLASGRTVEREPLLARICDRLEIALDAWDPGELASQYRSRSLVVGRRVSVTGAVSLQGVAQSVRDDGSLELRLDDGTVQVVNAGDVSLRPA